MIRPLLEPVNFLILDEPTNHLDMRTKDVLKEAIRAFDGTAIIVSHDRDFLDGLVTKVYEFGGGKVREYLGGIYDFLEKNKLTSLADIQRPSGIKPETPRTAPEEGRLAYEQQKERAKRLRKLERTATEAVKMLESQMNDPANASDATLFTRHASMSKQLETAMSEWEKAEEELERFNAEN